MVIALLEVPLGESVVTAGQNCFYKLDASTNVKLHIPYGPHLARCPVDLLSSFVPDLYSAHPLGTYENFSYPI